MENPIRHSELAPFKQHESSVRGYIRSFPTLFDHASGSHLYDADGRAYIDFFAGAGVLNYGHNPPALRQALSEYLESGGVIHSLDMATSAKRDFVEAFVDTILEPRGLDYKLQFPGPTGTNAVEAALKLARKVTGRHNVIAFTGGFHGMTLGALATTSNRSHRDAAGVPLSGVTRMPFEGFLGPDVDTIEVLERFLASGGGVDLPAAAIVETVQAEGGVHPASARWLRRLSDVLEDHGILLIVDDIQAGCGRAGPFFSFEVAGIEPDMVLLSKSLSGFGLPMALVLMKPELDEWAPGEHNGTFRGQNLSFVTGRTALDYWSDPERMEESVRTRGRTVEVFLEGLLGRHPVYLSDARGRGLLRGVEFSDSDECTKVANACFERGLIVETCGEDGDVLKILPPLTIEEALLDRGLEIISEEVARAANEAASNLATAGSAA